MLSFCYRGATVAGRSIRTCAGQRLVGHASARPADGAHRLKSTLSVVPPSASADRQVPTPLLLLSASRWTAEPRASELYSELIASFSQHGYESLLLDLDPDADLDKLTDAAELLSLFQSDMVSTLRDATGGSPFPPVLLARGVAAIVAQKYVSSHPLTALQLIDPPLSNQHLARQRPGLLPSALDEFKFHTKFPLRVVWSQHELERQQQQGIPWYDIHRIEHIREEEADESLDRFVFHTEHDMIHDTRAWLEDEVGVSDEPITSIGRTESRRQMAASDDVGFLEDEDDEPLDKDPTDAAVPPPSTIDAAEGASESATTALPTPANLPAWFEQGTYVLQPHSRKYPLTLDERHLSESFVRGSGPGGQAINKLSINVQLVHLPTSTRVTCQETRSRQRNRELARRRLSRVLEQLVRGEAGGESRIDREIGKERRKKANKKKKQAKRKREKETIKVAADAEV